MLIASVLLFYSQPFSTDASINDKHNSKLAIEREKLDLQKRLNQIVKELEDQKKQREMQDKKALEMLRVSPDIYIKSILAPLSEKSDIFEKYYYLYLEKNYQIRLADKDSVDKNISAFVNHVNKEIVINLSEVKKASKEAEVSISEFLQFTMVHESYHVYLGETRNIQTINKNQEDLDSLEKLSIDTITVYEYNILSNLAEEIAASMIEFAVMKQQVQPDFRYRDSDLDFSNEESRTRQAFSYYYSRIVKKYPVLKNNEQSSRAFQYRMNKILESDYLISLIKGHLISVGAM